jgi:hypothetical protein
VRAGAGDRGQNHGVALVHRSGSSTTPIVVNGRTITMRARTWSVPVHLGPAHLWLVHAGPDHVEVLEPDGRHHTLRVHDVTFLARAAISAASIAGVTAARWRRRNLRSER